MKISESSEVEGILSNEACKLGYLKAFLFKCNNNVQCPMLRSAFKIKFNYFDNVIRKKTSYYTEHYVYSIHTLQYAFTAITRGKKIGVLFEASRKQ